MIPEAILGLLVTIFIAIISWHIKSDISRYNQLEDHINDLINSKLDKAEVRHLINDKVDPLRQDIKELREDVQQMNQLLIRLLQNVGNHM